MAESIGEIQLDLGVNQSGFSKEINAIAGMAGKAGLAIAAAFSVKKLIEFGEGAIELGSNLSEVQNVVDVTFGDMAAQVNQFAKSALDDFGLSELSAKKYTSTMGAMLKSMGFARDTAAQMSEVITGLSGDFSSFYNLNSDDTFRKIRSGLAGETEPLKELGINMSIANLQAYALSQGITKSWEAMSQQEQAMLRYNYLLSVTKDAQGDFARTSMSWANQTRILTERFNSFKATIGIGLINLLTPALAVVNDLLGRLQTLAEYFRVFTSALMGQNSEQQTNTSNAVEGTNKLIDAQNNLGKAINKVAKEKKGALAGFDELNILQQNNSSGSDDGASAGGSGMQMPDLNMPKIDTSNIEVPKKEISKMAEFTKKILDKLFEPFKNSWKTYGTPIIEDSKKLMEVLWSTFEKTGQTLYEIWANPHVQKSVGAIVGVFGDLWHIIVRIYDEFAKPVVSNFLDALNPNKNPAMNLLLYVIGDVFQAIKDFTGFLANEGLTGLLMFFNPLKDTNTVDTINRIWTGIKNIFSGFIGWISSSFSSGWQSSINWLSNILSGFKSVVSGVISGLKDVFYGLTNFIAGTFSGNWQRAWDGVKQIFKGVANALGAVLKTPMNGVISIINDVIDRLNRIHIDVPWWVPGIGGESFEVYVPHIPYLAKGGIIDQPTLAMVGERGKEAVMPLENNTGWITELASQIATILAASIGNGNSSNYGNTPLEIVLQLGDVEFARFVIDAINNYQKRIGKTVLVV